MFPTTSLTGILHDVSRTRVNDVYRVTIRLHAYYSTRGMCIVRILLYYNYYYFIPVSHRAHETWCRVSGWRLGARQFVLRGSPSVYVGNGSARTENFC